MNDASTKINEFGTQMWFNSEGKYHRDGDLPAVISPDRFYTWYQNDKIHRDNDLPANIWTDGYCEWYKNGKFIKRKRCTFEEAEQYKKPYQGK